MFKSRLFYPMVWPVQTLWMLGLALALVCAAVSCPAAMTGKPSILSIGVEQNELVVTIAVPAGAKRITLQSTRRLGQGGWIPRAVRLIEEPVETVTLRLAMSEELEILRVRAEDKQGLPASFFKGTNAFAGVANPGGAVDVRAFDGLGLPPPSVPVAVAPDAPNARAVVESDIWKVEQDTLYFFNQFRGLQVIDLSNPDSPVITGTLNLPAAGEQMYLLPGRQVVLLARSLCNWNGRSDSQVVIVNANSPNPQILAELAVPGQIRESRMVGSALYVVSQAYKQRPNSDDWEWGTAITSFDLSNPALPSAKESLWFSGSTSAITASDRFLFVASNSWAQRPQTRVQVVDISDPTGVLRSAAVLMIAGTVQDKFKMNLNGDVFSVIAEEWNSETGRPVTRLRTFSLANPDAPAALGEVEVGHGERLFATRFDGTKVYIVTFLRIDPLWVVDLSDPKNPTVRGELEIPGWSTYIQPMGDRLLTIGIDNVNGWRVAVSLFNVSNPAAPALLSKVPLGDNHSWSEATHDEKAFGVLPDLGMLLVPVSAYSTNYQQGVQILDFTRDTLTKRGFITQQMVPRRATALQNRVLSISSRELMTVDVTDRDRPVTTSKLELSWRVDRVLGQGDFLLEIGGNAYDNAAPAIRVARKTDPATIVGGITLTNLYLIGSELRGDRLYILQRSHPNYWFVPVSPNNGPQTNSPILKLSVLDLSRLPAITLEGSVETATDDRIASQMTGHWMDSGALVWTPKQNDYWGYDWYRGPMPLMIDSAWGMPAFWYWNPDPTFYAFAVNQPSAPRFLSRVDFSENKDWSNFSAAWPVENLLYLSHQTYERVVTGTNRHIYTNYVWVTVTNIFPQTNVVVYTDYSKVTNFTTLTNITLLATRIKLAEGMVWPAEEARRQKLGSGAFHLSALMPDGKVYAWGWNHHGQLGDGTDQDRSIPLAIGDLPPVSAIVSGITHHLALTPDGKVWAWGSDVFGQIGDGKPASNGGGPPLPEFASFKPVLLQELPAIARLGTGWQHSFALDQAGHVWGWGGTWAGQLGFLGVLNQSSPIQIPNLENIVQVTGGLTHSVALRADGIVLAWGGNDRGQLGDGSRISRATPQALENLSGVREIALGEAHNLALKNDGTVWTWGANQDGQLGLASITDGLEPQPVSGLSDVVTVAAGASHSLALKADGTVWGWGRNDAGQLGGGPGAPKSGPEPVPQLNQAIAIAAGLKHSVAMLADGSIQVWGDNSFGQSGQGQAITSTNFQTLTNIETVVTRRMVTNIVWKTNLQNIQRAVVITNEYEIAHYLTHSHLDVVDYTTPELPTLRKPVSIPGRLIGVSHAGELIYTRREEWRTNTPPQSVHIFSASAYDGVASYLVDSLEMAQSGPRAVAMNAEWLYLSMPAPDTNSNPAIEIWAISDAGKWARVSATQLTSTAHDLSFFDGLLAVQNSEGLLLFDRRDPTALRRIGDNPFVGCIGYQLDFGWGSVLEGLWLPLGDYGVAHMKAEPSPSP